MRLSVRRFMTRVTIGRARVLSFDMFFKDRTVISRWLDSSCGLGVSCGVQLGPIRDEGALAVRACSVSHCSPGHCSGRDHDYGRAAYRQGRAAYRNQIGV